MQAPGFVPDLGAAGQAGWDSYFERMLNGPRGLLAAATQANGGTAPSLLFDGDPLLEPGVLQVDWSAYPVRVKQAIDVPDAGLDEYIDWTRNGLTFGRGFCHEEYLEWRSVRQADGRLIRLEFTSETPDYWARLARFEPQKVIELAGRFAGETPDRVNIRELFGLANPFVADPSGEAGLEVERTFAAQNYAGAGPDGLPTPPPGAYNNGLKAILHMANSVNSTRAAVALAIFAAYPHGKTVDGEDMALSGPEAIEATPQQAVNCRNSDPTIVGSMVSQVFAGSKVALLDPFGIYILSPGRDALSFADGAPVPDSWFSLQRGTLGSANPTGRNLFQRLVVQAPAGSGLTLADLIDPDGRPVETGAQLARLINVGLLARRTDRGAVTVPRNIVQEPVLGPCDGTSADSQLFIEGWNRFSAEQAPVAVPTVRLRNG